MEEGRVEGKHEANTETAFSPYLNHMRKFSLDKLHQILKKMPCRKNSIDNEQDNIICFATFVVYLPPKRTNKRVDSKNIFLTYKIYKAYEKVIYSSVWRIICYVC